MYVYVYIYICVYMYIYIYMHYECKHMHTSGVPISGILQMLSVPKPFSNCFRLGSGRAKIFPEIAVLEIAKVLLPLLVPLLLLLLLLPLITTPTTTATAATATITTTPSMQRWSPSNQCLLSIVVQGAKASVEGGRTSRSKGTESTWVVVAGPLQTVSDLVLEESGFWNGHNFSENCGFEELPRRRYL